MGSTKYFYFGQATTLNWPLFCMFAYSREADDEASRQANERARVEVELAAVLAENTVLKASAETERARANRKEVLAEKLHIERSEERSSREKLEDEVEGFRATAAAQAERTTDLEEQLRAARDEIARLESDKKQAALLSAAASGTCTVVSGDCSGSSVHSSPNTSASEESNGGDARRDSSVGGAESEDGFGGQHEDEQEEALPVGTVGDCGSSSGSRVGDSCEGDDPRIGEEQETEGREDEGQEQEEDGGVEAQRPVAAAATGAASSPSLVARTSASSSDSDAGEDEAPLAAASAAEEEQKREHHAEPCAKKVVKSTRGRRKLLGQAEEKEATAASARRSKRVALKPLGNVENGATPARHGNGVSNNGKKNGSCVDEEKRLVFVSDDSSDEIENKEGKMERSCRRLGLRGRSSKAKELVMEENARKDSEREERSKCRQTRWVIPRMCVGEYAYRYQ